jgi:hypothetical protein
MQYHKKLSTTLLVLALLLSACAGNNAPTEDPEVLMTSAVGTLVASFFETQTAMVTPSTITPTATETKFPTPTSAAVLSPILSSPTATFLFYTATLGTPRTPTVTGTLPTATVNSSALAYGCSNLAFVRHVNYPDETVMSPGQNFTKTWKVENNGTCDWLFGYRLTVVDGGNMDPTIHGSLGKLVKPGSWAELSATLSAPTKAGTYTAYFRFSDGSHQFGATLGVTIKVENAPANTAVPANTNTSAPTSTNTSTNVPPSATLTLPPTETQTLTPVTP